MTVRMFSVDVSNLKDQRPLACIQNTGAHYFRTIDPCKTLNYTEESTLNEFVFKPGGH